MNIGVKQRDLFTYQLLDYIAAVTAWGVFFYLRKTIENTNFNWFEIFNDRNFYLGILIIPIFWISLYYIFDKYRDVYSLSRGTTIFRTGVLCFFGALILFFTILRDDVVLNYVNYFKNFSLLFLLHYGLTIFGRLLWLSHVSKKFKSGKIKYNSLLVGSGDNAKALLSELSNTAYGRSFHVLGHVSDSTSKLENVEHFGSLDKLTQIIKKYDIEEVLVAVQEKGATVTDTVVQQLAGLNPAPNIKLKASMQDILLGRVKMNRILSTPLIALDTDLMPRWQWIVKRTMDIIGSVFGLIIFSPILLYASLRLRTSEEGEVFFKQERIGKGGRPFNIIKFRSMHNDAELNGPQLSYDGDNRITTFGKVLRKWRIDELPQFWNVLKNEMAIVGPRPERQYYINQIMQNAPYYSKLLRVKPGITSWGQIKFGYASNLDQMIQRLKYDMLYIENMSILLDLKIIFYTIIILFQGKGK